MKTPAQRAQAPLKDVGIGLRSCHFQHITQHKPNIPWFEALSDNYLTEGGSALEYLYQIRKDYPMALHGVGLSLGSIDPLNTNYLTKLKALINSIEPQLVSDHLSWSSVNGNYLHDLLPLPFTEEAINHSANRIKQAQDFLGTQILVENASSYLEFKNNEMQEWEFLNAVAEKADCFILLDINNVYVSAYNHDTNPEEYITHIKKDRVKQFHLAGFADKTRYLFDTHGELIHQPVWDLYAKALARFGAIPTLIEWDDNIPIFSTLENEAKKAQTVMDKLMREGHTC